MLIFSPSGNFDPNGQIGVGLSWSTVSLACWQSIKKANERRFEIEDFDVSKLVEDPFSTNFVDEEIKSSVFASVGPK